METDSLKVIDQVVHELLGEQLTSVVLIAAYIFAFCGMFLRWFWQYQVKGKPDPNTPDKFVFSYWLKDNLLPKLFGILATLIILFVSLRFPQEILGTGFSYFYAFTVGISLDYVSSMLKKLQKST